MATGAELDINAPAPEGRTRATLLSVAQRIPTSELSRSGTDRMIGGVTWLPWPDIAVNREEADCDTVYNKVPRALPEVAVQSAFLLWDSVKCSTAGMDLSMLAQMASYGLEEEGFLSAQFAMELENATLSTGLDLVGSVAYPPTIVAPTAVGLDVAIARLETYLATTSLKPGMRGTIHLTPALLTLAAADDLIEFRGDVYRTATGHAVIGDAGHTGQETPQGGSGPGADQAWIYATGDIWYGVSDMKGVTTSTDPDGGAVHIAHNDLRPLAERYGIIVFDPNTVAAALVSVAASDGGGSGGGSAGYNDVAASNATLTNVDDTTTATTLLPANASRLGVIVENDSTADLYLKYGAGASATSRTVKIAAGGYWEMPTPIYTGLISGVWATDGTGAARITELT